MGDEERGKKIIKIYQAVAYIILVMIMDQFLLNSSDFCLRAGDFFS